MRKFNLPVTWISSLWLLLVLALPVHAGPNPQPPQPATDNGRAWLLANQNTNGTWGTANSTRDTAVVLAALQRLGVTGSPINGGVAHLAGLAAPDHDTLTRQIVASAGAGFDSTALVTTLVAGQNAMVLNPAFPNFPEGGWGSAPGYATNVLDTLLALDALYAAGQAATSSITQPAVAYLRTAQHSDGGWGLQVYGDSSNVYLTAHVLLTLQAYSGYVEAGNAAATGAAWLVNQQQADGGWGNPTTVYETALAWRALKQLNVAPANPSGAQSYLLSRQQGDGSWNGRAYDTAVALLALQDGLILPTPTATVGPAATATNTRPPTPTITPTWTATPIPLPTATLTPFPTNTPAPTLTPTPSPVPPPAPPTLSQPENADNDGNYLLTWSTVTDATSYELEEKSGPIANYVLIYTGTATDFAVTNRSATTHCYHVRTLRNGMASAWSNQVCVTVAPPTPTPTFTPLPTATPLPVNGAMLYIGSDSGGTVGGVTFADEDILAFDTATSSWSLYLDGSDVGSTGNIDGFQLESDGSLLLTLEGNATLAGVGAVTGNDILRFTPTSLGATTAGTFTWVLDGSDVELEATGENIDGISRAPDGRLLISTNGSFAVTPITGEDKDLLVFNATSLGETSAGSWELYFDGSDVGLNVAGEDIWDVWVDSATGYIYLTTYVNYSIPGPGGGTISGDGDDIFICIPGSLGENTTCTYSPYWNGDLYGFDEYMDTLSIVLSGGAQPTPTPTSATTPTAVPTATPTHTPLPTATPTDTPAVTPTATPVVTSTNTPAVTPTATPTATPTGSSSTIIYVGSDGSGTVSGITFADEDILAFDTATNSWSLYFDGSDVGATQDVDAFYLESDGTLLLSFYSPTTLSGVGSVDRSDIIRFTPTTLGETTAGTFAWVLDGSDVELADVAENIDAISRAPDGRLVVSTYGGYAVTGASGTDADLLIFTATTLGETSAGTWALYFDGSDVGLTTGTEDIWGAWIDPATGGLYLNTYLNFSAVSTNSLSGDGDDIFLCLPSSLGETTTCTFSLFWNGDTYGFNFYLDSMSIGGLVTSATTRGVTAETAVPAKIYLPLIAR